MKVQTLTEWSIEHACEHCIVRHEAPPGGTLCMCVVGVHAGEDRYAGLWSLVDYAVSSVSCGSVYLVLR